MSAQSDEQVRRDFEAWHKERSGISLMRHTNGGDYVYAESEWQLWLSRQAEIDCLKSELEAAKKKIEVLESPDYWFDNPEWIDESESFDDIQGYIDNSDLEIGDTFEMTPVKILAVRKFRVTANDIGYERVNTAMEAK